MSRRVLALLGTAALLALGAWGSSAASRARAARASCAPAGAHVMASDPNAEVYSAGGFVYGCTTRRPNVVRLGRSRLCIDAARVQRVALAGSIVAYALERCGIDTGSATVEVRQMATGRVLSSHPAVRGPVPVESYPSIGSLAVRRDGAVAWIATSRSIVGHGELIEVHRGRAVLDSGPAIAPSSLRARGSTLSWRHGGATRTASFA